MKKLIFILAIVIALTSCRTCPKCPPIYDPIVVSPTVACHIPDDLPTLEKKFKSNEDAYTDGELIEILAYNVELLKTNTEDWVGYRICVEKSVAIYDELKKKLEENHNKSEASNK